MGEYCYHSCFTDGKNGTMRPSGTGPDLDRWNIVAGRKIRAQVCLAPKPMCLKHSAVWNEKEIIKA